MRKSRTGRVIGGKSFEKRVRSKTRIAGERKEIPVAADEMGKEGAKHTRKQKKRLDQTTVEIK